MCRSDWRNDVEDDSVINRINRNVQHNWLLDYSLKSNWFARLSLASDSLCTEYWLKTRSDDQSITLRLGQVTSQFA